MICRLLVLSIFIVAACSTPYQERGLFGGVSATQIDETTLRVTGRGNAYTDPATIQDYVLLKAAEETVAHGYDMFLIVDTQSSQKMGAVMTPGTSRSVTTGSASAYGYGNYAYGVGSATTTTTHYPGQTFLYSKPRTDIVVKMLKGAKPADAPAGLFVAEEVIKYLRPRYSN